MRVWQVGFSGRGGEADLSIAWLEWCTLSRLHRDAFALVPVAARDRKLESAVPQLHRHRGHLLDPPLSKFPDSRVHSSCNLESPR